MKLLSVVFILIALSITLSVNARPTPMYCAVCETVVDEINQAINEAIKQHDYSVQTRFRIDEKRASPYARSEPYLLSLIEDTLPSIIKQYGVLEQSKDQSTSQSIKQSVSSDQAKAAKRAKKNQRVHLMKQRDFDAMQSLNQPTATAEPTGEPTTEQSVEQTISEQATEQATTEQPVTEQQPKINQSTKQLNRSVSTTAEISRLFDHLVDHHLESLLLAFHRDFENIKQSICIETARACKKGTLFDVVDHLNNQSNGSADTVQPTLALPSGDEHIKQSNDPSTTREL